MQPVIARCGNRCDLCPLFRGNFTAASAAAVNRGIYRYHHDGEGPKPHYAHACDGCLSDGRLARPGCAIRACVLGKGYATCAECPHLYCDLLERDMVVIEGALAKHRDDLDAADFDLFFRPFLIREALGHLRGARH